MKISLLFPGRTCYHMVNKGMRINEQMPAQLFRYRRWDKEALVVDPHLGQMDILFELLNEIKRMELTAAAATYYHLDHSDGLEMSNRLEICFCRCNKCSRELNQDMG